MSSMDWQGYPSLLPFEKLFVTHSEPSLEEALALRSLRDQLRSESTPIHQQIVQLRARKSSLRRQLTLIESLLCPAQYLPQDIFQEIFCRLSPLADLPQVATVCRSWRDATRALPQLWSTVTIADSDQPGFKYNISDRLERCIGRAGHVPLTLIIDVERFTDAFGTAGRLVQLILNMESRSRWRSIMVTGREMDALFPHFFHITNLQKGQIPYSGRWTQLRNLHIQDAPISTSRARKPIEASLTTMPSLRSLFIFMSEDCPISSIQAPWAQLRSLCLKLASPESDSDAKVFDLSIYLHILKECSNLLECALTVKCGQETTLTSDTLVELPNLIRLELRAWNLPNQFFTQFKTPNLEELGVCVEAGVAPDDQKAFFPHYLACFGSRLRRLFLSMPWDATYLLPSLSSLLELVELNLTFQKHPIQPFLRWITFDANKNLFNLPKLKTLLLYSTPTPDAHWNAFLAVMPDRIEIPLATPTADVPWDAFTAAMHSRIEIPLATHTVPGQTQLPPPAMLTSATLFGYTPLGDASTPRQDEGVQYVYIPSERDFVWEESLNPAHIGRFGMPCPRTDTRMYRVGRSNLTSRDLQTSLPRRPY